MSSTPASDVAREGNTIISHGNGHTNTPKAPVFKVVLSLASSGGGKTTTADGEIPATGKPVSIHKYFTGLGQKFEANRIELSQGLGTATIFRDAHMKHEVAKVSREKGGESTADFKTVDLEHGVIVCVSEFKNLEEDAGETGGK